MRVPRWVVGVVVLWICLITAAAGSGARRFERQDGRFEEIVADLQEQREVDRARGCVQSWEGRQGVREVIGGLIAAAQDADPARVAAFQEDMARRLPDPECDLAAADRIVAEAEARADEGDGHD